VDEDNQIKIFAWS